MALSVSKRKPHNNDAGYVCSLKSKHPHLPGHFVVYDREADPAPDIDADDRWVLVYQPDETRTTRAPSMLSCKTQRIARDLMKAMAAGSDEFDFGQHDD